MVGIFLLLCVALTLSTGPEVHAQGASSRGYPSYKSTPLRKRMIPPHVVVRRLTNRGYHAFRSLEFRNGRYVVRALNRRGQPTRVIVDARTGKVLD